MTFVEGMGQLPERWRVERARWLLSRKRRPVPAEAGVVTAFRDGQVTLRQNRRTDGFTEAIQEFGYQGVRKGDLVVHAMDGFAGAIGVSDSDGKSSPVVHVYTASDDVDLRFVAYVLRHLAGAGFVSSLAKGIRERSTSFDPATLARLMLPVPPLHEQRRIADFLDAETARIDRLLRLRQRQGDLERCRLLARISEIYEKATRQSAAVRLGYLLRSIEQGWSPQCEDRLAEDHEFGVLKAGCVNGGIFRPKEHKALPAAVKPRTEYIVRPGDLLMSRASGSLDLIGSAAVLPAEVPTNLILCDKVYRLRMLPSVDPHFVALMLRSHPIREAIKLGTSGAEGMANNLPTRTIRDLRMPLISSDEQRRFAAALHDQEGDVAQAVSLLNRSTSLMRERREALIAAAVTGQVDVATTRGAA